MIETRLKQIEKEKAELVRQVRALGEREENLRGTHQMLTSLNGGLR